MGGERGKIILHEIPEETFSEIAAFLAPYISDNGSETNIIEKLRQTPFVLKKDLSAKEAQVLLEGLKGLGAKVSFRPIEEKNLSQDKVLDRLNEISKQCISDPDEVPCKLVRPRGCSFIKERILEEILKVNKEFWLILSLVSLTALMNFLVDSQRLLLNFYTLPTIFSAYYFGRKHAVLTALASILVVLLMLYYLPQIFNERPVLFFQGQGWQDFTIWGGVLLITAYAMGTLYDRYRNKIKELQKTYRGILVILRHFISQDEYTENHCYRVSVYAVKIAQHLGLPEERIEDLRAAALLHDLGKLKISREILYKAAKLSQEEFEEIKRHVSSATDLLDPVESSLGRVIPIILAHHEKCDGTGYLGLRCNEIPLEAKILAVADVYDALVSDRPYRKGLPPFEAKEIIVKGAGKHFDPQVVRAFVRAFEAGEMDLPKIVL